MTIISSIANALFGVSEPVYEAIDRGWRSVMYDRWPSGTDKVWLWRTEWPFPSLREVDSIQPEMNVYGLWWKPWRPSDDEAPP